MRIEKPTLEEQVIKDQKEKPLPQPMVKIALLACLTVLSMGLFWYTVSGVFNSQLDLSFQLGTIIAIVFSALAFSLMFAIIGISEVLVERQLLFLAVLIIAAMTHFIFFPFAWANIIAALSMTFAFTVWKQNIRADLKSRITFIVGRVMMVGMGTAVSIVFVAVSFTYYGYLTADTGSDRFVEGFVDTMVDSANKALPNYVSYYDPEMTLDEFILESTTSSEEVPVIPTDSIVGDALRQGIENAQGAILAEARSEFLATFGIEASGDEKMAVIVEKIVHSRVDSIISPYKTFLPAILALSLFFVLKIFGFILKPLIQTFSYFLYKLLLLVGFVKVEKVITEKERVTLAE
ncbi:MAG: hypothetical protein V1685_01505 [Parcubacteria group bacterium]